jgi:hypothetical protein
MPGPHGYVIALALACAVHAALLMLVLRVTRLAPSRADYLWLAGGLLPLLLFA